MQCQCQRLQYSRARVLRQNKKFNLCLTRRRVESNMFSVHAFAARLVLRCKRYVCAYTYTRRLPTWQGHIFTKPPTQRRVWSSCKVDLARWRQNWLKIQVSMMYALTLSRGPCYHDLINNLETVAVRSALSAVLNILNLPDPICTRMEDYIHTAPPQRAASLEKTIALTYNLYHLGGTSQKSSCTQD